MEGSIKGNGRKRKSLTLEDRIKIIERISAGERQVDVADKMNISPSTVASIYRRKDIILNFKDVVESCGGGLQMKKCRGTNFINREAELYNWFIQQKEAGLPVSGNHLQEKALEFNKIENDNNSKFKASNGWLYKFKKRTGMCITRPSKIFNRSEENSDSSEKRDMMDLKTDLEDIDKIYQCDGVKYSVTLGAMDGHSGQNFLYKLQIWQYSNQQKYSLLHIWSENNKKSWKLEPMPLDMCIKTFEFLFLEKSGNLWIKRDQFIKQPFKMDLINN